MRKTGLALALTAALCNPAAARADVVSDWNAIAIGVPAGNPFNQARIVAATQLAVFEAVNAIQGSYRPYLGTVTAPADASVDAAVIAAAHGVLKAYVPASAAMLDAARTTGLAAIPDGAAKSSGIATGEAAAAAILAARLNDGAVPGQFYLPASSGLYEWQPTPGCPPAGGVFFNWPNVTPFGIASAEAFRADPPPALNSTAYAKNLNEVKRVGRKDSTARPQDRTDVAQFYAATSPAYIFNMAARQIAAAGDHSQLQTARALALINMAINDAAVASFATKYHYTTWRPETAIHNADIDENDRTEADPTWEPLIVAPCFPSYTSNHASLSGAGAEVLRRLYGEGGHAITITNPAFPTLAYRYSTFNQILSDIDDARVFGGIHFRFDQDEGGRLGRAVGTAVYKDNLRAVNGGGSH
jgi:hypothetical protein